MPSLAQEVPPPPNSSLPTKKRITKGNATIRGGGHASVPELALGLPRLSLEAAQPSPFSMQCAWSTGEASMEASARPKEVQP